MCSGWCTFLGYETISRLGTLRGKSNLLLLLGFEITHSIPISGTGHWFDLCSQRKTIKIKNSNKIKKRNKTRILTQGIKQTAHRQLPIANSQNKKHETQSTQISHHFSYPFVRCKFSMGSITYIPHRRCLHHRLDEWMVNE